MDGILLDCDQSQVRLQKVQGSVIIVALDRLSTSDKRFVLDSRKALIDPMRETTPGATGTSDRKTSGSTQATSSEAQTGLLSKLAAGWSSAGTPSAGDADAVASVGRLMFQPGPPMPQNILYLRLSRHFLQQVAAREVSQREAVNDNILESKVTGVSQTVASTGFELQSNEQSGSGVIYLTGTTTFNTVADAGKIQVLLTGVTRFASAKAILLDGEGIHLGRSATNAITKATITGVQTSLPGLRGRLALRLGGRRAERDLPEAEAITAQHSERKVNEGFDVSASDDVANTWKAIAAQVACLPANDPLRHCSWQASSTNDALRIVFVAPASGGKDALVAAPSPVLADAEVEVQVHVALVRRILSDVELQKLLLPLQEASTRGATARGMPAGRPVMHWSNDHNWLSLCWEHGDQPADPAQPMGAAVASRRQ